MTALQNMEDPAILRKVAAELQALRSHDSVASSKSTNQHSDGLPFPPTCFQLLRSIHGNCKCVDCGRKNPEWASVTYGVLLCTQCAGKHRSYGVNISRVRSITMDCWSHSQVLAMLEGGNTQLQTFFSRHDMGNEKSRIFDKRYQTKAARFYRNNMERHIANIEQVGEWQGRAASRKCATTQTKQTQKPIPDSRQQVAVTAQ